MKAAPLGGSNEPSRPPPRAALAGRHHVGYGHRIIAAHAQGAFERGKVYTSLIQEGRQCPAS